MTRTIKILKYMLRNGYFSEREGVINLNLTSGRNEINEFERDHKVRFNRIKTKAENGSWYYKYTFKDIQQRLYCRDYIEKGLTSKKPSPNKNIIQKNTAKVL